MSKTIKINDLKHALREEFIKEFRENNESNDGDDFFLKRIETAEPIDTSNMPEIEDDDSEYNEMLEEYVGSLYDIKTRLENLMESLTYYDETNGEAFSGERAKLSDALQIITDLYDE